MKNIYIVLFLITVVLPFNSFAQSDPNVIAASIILSNVPESPDFGRLLIRDLGYYFGYQDGKHFSISYEMLRDYPTQTGISYPKFYLWEKVIEDNHITNGGAVRVAAIEKQRFEITHYISDEDIEVNPERIFMIFPAPIWEKIRAKIK